MRRKLFSILLTTLALCSLVGCKNDGEVIDDITPTPTEIVTPEPTKELDALYDLATEQSARYGATGIYVYELLETIESGESFYVYVENELESNVDLKNAITYALENKNVNCQVPFYVIDFSSLNETEQEKILEYFVPGTVYSVKDKKVVSSFTKIPEETVEDYTTQYNSFFEKWMYSTMIDIDMHSIKEIISYEDILTKIENKETFAIYVGRDTCKFCKVFTKPMQEVLKENDFEYPIYYFYTQSYKNAIDNEEENGQETWDSVKETLGFNYTPSFIVYKDGIPTYYDNFVGSEYFDADDIQKEELNKATKEDFYDFLNDNSFIKECIDVDCPDDCPDGCD